MHIEEARFCGQNLNEAVASVQVEPLTEAYKEEALAFLAERPFHTIIMAGWIIEYGIESPAHRGTFYGCWNVQGVLEGVALIGRATMFETRSDVALLAFAELVKQHPNVHLISAEEGDMETFWRAYAREGQRPRRLCRELLYEKSAEPYDVSEVIGGLRKATLGELEQIVSAHAESFVEEAGENPLEKDADGFRSRCAQRIEQGRVWILMKKGELIFKADVVTQTPLAFYIEGIWVNPKERQKGYGQLCWAALSRALLAEKPALCGFVNAEHLTARAFYEKGGCRLRARYDKVYL